MDMYEQLEKKQGEILDRARRVPEEIGIPKSKLPDLGLSGGSATHAMMLQDCVDAMNHSARKLTRLATLDVEVRRLIKQHYGDDYDGAVMSTCEAALWVAYSVLFMPSMARGLSSVFRYIAPYERHIHHQAAYGSPVPPKYKDVTADRGVTAGELGLQAKRLTNLEVLLVPLPGADYTCHGIKYHPCTLMQGVDAGRAVAQLAKTAEVHRPFLSGFASMGYDTPGYGYGQRGQSGESVLMRGIGELASAFDVPYVVDNARGTPFIGTDLRAVKADLIVYSTDKAFPGPTGGLIIGREDVMVPIRRAIGIHGQRWGTSASHGKAGFVMADPGQECMAALIAILRILLETPERLSKPVDEFHAIVLEEFEGIRDDLGCFAEGFTITKSYNSLGTEISYERTWQPGRMGLPVFSIEDMYSGTNLIQSGLREMGLVPPLGYDGNMIVGPGLGTTDPQGNLLEPEARWVVRALFRMLAILADTLE
ncbi:MAG: hypothetical protein RDU89_00720 [bacterium]|nr:hypothetical protein [bacterium]